MYRLQQHQLDRRQRRSWPRSGSSSTRVSRRRSRHHSRCKAKAPRNRLLQTAVLLQLCRPSHQRQVQERVRAPLEAPITRSNRTTTINNLNNSSNIHLNQHSEFQQSTTFPLLLFHHTICQHLPPLQRQQ